MNTLKTLGMSVVLASTISSAALADNMYFKVDAGIAKPTLSVEGVDLKDVVKSKNSFSGSIGVGYKFDKNIRTEFDVRMHSYKLEAGDSAKDFAEAIGSEKTEGSAKSKIFTGMISAYYDFTQIHEDFTPYVGAGIGTSYHQIKMDEEKLGERFNFAYQLSAGMGFKVSEEATIDLGYKFIDHAASQNIKVRTHNALIGLRYNF